MLKTTATSLIEGHVLIRDHETGEVIVDKKNAIHFENMSEALALSLANRAQGNIHEMVFGNGASTVSGTGAITYFPPNITGQDARLYNQTFTKVVNDMSPLNPDRNRNHIRVQHGQNNVYTDIIITCLLDFNEPAGQEFFDDAEDNEGQFVFDELGLKSFDPLPNNGKLLTHVIFHPVQKSLNRTIEIVYTLRIYLC
jgi:hypothetical protein